jgi:hypothetical protein
MLLMARKITRQNRSCKKILTKSLTFYTKDWASGMATAEPRPLSHCRGSPKRKEHPSLLRACIAETVPYGLNAIRTFTIRNPIRSRPSPLVPFGFHPSSF